MQEDDESASENYLLDVLETVSSEVGSKKIFTTDSTKYVPDFVLCFIFISVFCLSTGLDVFFLYYLFIEVKFAAFGVLYYLTSWTSIFCMILLDEGHGWSIEGKLQVLVFALVILHLESLFIGGMALKSAFQQPSSKHVEGVSHAFFHITNNNISYMRIYCFLSSVLKCIPQLFIVSIFLSINYHRLKESLVVLCEIIMFHNMVIFSLAMSLLFPIRKSPRVFASGIALFINGAVKFLATMCACCLFLTIFTQTFKSIGYYALLLRSVRIPFLIWPCWRSLQYHCRSHERPLASLFIYCPMLCLALSFIYFHPFAGRGKLIYYVLYLANFLTDLFSLYVFTPADTDHATLVYSLAILLGGFASIFGLVNVLHKFKTDRIINPDGTETLDFL